MANQGHNPLVAIQMALSGQLYAETGWAVTKQQRMPPGADRCQPCPGHPADSRGRTL